MQTQVRQARHDENTATLSQPGEGRDAPSRRTFLIGGAAAGLTAAATTQLPVRAQASKSAIAENLLPAAAIGYWDGLNAAVKPAANLLWGDRSLIDNGVRVTVHGLGNRLSDPNVAAFSLLAHFPTRQAGISIPFHAWNYRSDTLNHRSSPVSFRMAISRAEGLTLSVVYPKKADDAAGAKSRRSEHVCRFSLAGWNRQPKLRQGVYFVALPDSSSNALPTWEECQFVPEMSDGVLTGGTLSRATLTGLEPVTFHYLILSVDPMSPAGANAS